MEEMMNHTLWSPEDMDDYELEEVTDSLTSGG